NSRFNQGVATRKSLRDRVHAKATGCYGDCRPDLAPLSKPAVFNVGGVMIYLLRRTSVECLRPRREARSLPEKAYPPTNMGWRSLRRRWAAMEEIWAAP